MGGVGYKQRVFKIQKDSSYIFKCNFSIGAMAEEELLDRNQLNQGETHYTLYPRVISAATLNFKLNEKFSVLNTTYFQFYALSPGDFRLLNESSIIFSIIKNLSFDISFVYRYDSEPPSVLIPYDYHLSIGLQYSL